MDNAIHKIFEDFGSLLKTRLEKGVQTTEDSVRYTFFAALLQNGIRPEEIVLEYAHPSLEGHEKLDTWIERDGQRPIAIEFKYHRPIPSGHNVPKTQLAGDVFNDLERLSNMRESLNYFIYLASREMCIYFRNKFPKLWNLRMEERLLIGHDFFDKLPKTLLGRIKGVNGHFIEGAYRQQVSPNHFLRIFRVVRNQKSGERE